MFGLCGVFLGVGASFLLFACVGVECCVGVAVWFRTCALAPAPACGLAAHTDVGPGFDSPSPAKSIRSASHRTGNLAGTTEKSGVWEPLVRQEVLIQFTSCRGMLARLLKSCIFRTLLSLVSKFDQLID